MQNKQQTLKVSNNSLGRQVTVKQNLQHKESESSIRTDEEYKQQDQSLRSQSKKKPKNEFEDMANDLLQDSCFNVNISRGYSLKGSRLHLGGGETGQRSKSKKKGKKGAKGKNQSGNKKGAQTARKKSSMRAGDGVNGESQLNIQISARQKDPRECMFELQEILHYMESLEEKSKDYLVGINLEIELKKYQNPAIDLMPDEFYMKLQQFIRDHMPRVNHNRSLDRMSSKISFRTLKQDLSAHQVKIPQKFQNVDRDKKEKILRNLLDYENSLQQINAKDIQQFKACNGKGYEFQIGQCLLYFFAAFDTSILLTNDRKHLLNPTWEMISKYFANSGRILQNMRKLRESIEDDKIPNNHFSMINSLHSDIDIAEVYNDESVHYIIHRFLEAAIFLTKFVKVEINGVPEDKFKTPIRAKKQVQPGSPDPAQALAQNLQFSSYRKRMMSPEQRTTNDQIASLNQELFSKETENLIKSAAKLDRIKNQKVNLLQIQNQINKMKFEMEREEKEALKQLEKEEEKDYLEYQKEQILLNNKIRQEQMEKERQELERRKKEVIDDLQALKEKKKQDQEKLNSELKVDVQKEQNFKESIIQKQREDDKKVIEFKLMSMKEKERVLRDKYMEEKLKIQQERENERKKLIESQVKDLQKKEKELQFEIDILQKLKSASVKVPGKQTKA